MSDEVPVKAPKAPRAPRAVTPSVALPNPDLGTLTDFGGVLMYVKGLKND